MFNDVEMQLILDAVNWYLLNAGDTTVKQTYYTNLKGKITANYIGLIDQVTD